MDLSQALEAIIQIKKLNISKIYNCIRMDGSTFRKILNGVTRHPSLINMVKICLGLHLNDIEAEELLHKANYHLTEQSLFERVVQRYLRTEYKFREIDEALYELTGKGFDDYVRKSPVKKRSV